MTISGRVPRMMAIFTCALTFVWGLFGGGVLDIRLAVWVVVGRVVGFCVICNFIHVSVYFVSIISVV